MKKIHLVSLNKTIELIDTISVITIENPIYYRSIVYNILDEIIYSGNDVPIDIEKYSLIIKNPFELNVNDSKMIKLMYKKLDSCISDNDKLNLNLISESIRRFIFELSYDLDVPIDMSESLDVAKLFASVDLKFVDSTYESFVELILKYIKIYSMFTNLHIVFSFGLLNLITEEEIQMLEKEASLLDIKIVDFLIKKENSKCAMIIDKDWCII